MITVYDESFQSVLAALRGMADEMQAEEKIATDEAHCSRLEKEWTAAGESTAKKNAKEFWQNDPERNKKTAEDFEGLVDELVDEAHRLARRKADDFRASRPKRLPAETSILSAINEAAKEWRLTPDVFLKVADCITKLPAPAFDEDTRDAIARGYTATTVEAAEDALAKARADQATEQARRMEAVKRRRAELLRIEREQLEAEIEAQQAPHKRLAEIQTELVAVGG